MSRWQQTALIGIAKLTGSAALGAAPAALLAASVPDLIKILFERSDEARRRQAGEFAGHVAGVIDIKLREGIDPGTMEAARRAAAEALQRHGLTWERFVELDLDPQRAAQAVLANVGFSADERIEIRPLAEQVLVAFYDGIKKHQATFLELMPAITAALLDRSTRQSKALGDLRGEVREGFTAAEDAAERRHRDLMEAIAREKGVPIPPLLAVLRRLGEAEVAPEHIPARLEAAAERLLELEERLARSSNDRPETQAARARARALLDAGEFDAAEAVLREARAGLQALREQTAREEAALLTDEAGVAALRLEFRHAAELHREAARLLDFDPEAAWASWLHAAQALYVLGRDFGDPAMLGQAVDWLEQKALPRAPRATRPLDWAATQNNLGNAFATLGERGDDAALRAAVDAYRAALEERTRERVPLQWAATQTNLGNALQTLGARRGDDNALRAAIDAYREALQERTRERVPLLWAATQTNLGNALAILGERGDDTALRAAIDAYREALEVYTRERAPMQWAMTQNNLGKALATQGKRGDDDALREAVDAYREALQELTRARVPLPWAATQTNLGNALLTLGERGDDAALREAVAAYRAALEEYTRERAPMQWARTQENLALALRAQAERSRDAALIVEALAAIDGAIEEFAKRAAPHHLARAQQNRDRIVATARALGLP
jgi:hypothetical protein